MKKLKTIINNYSLPLSIIAAIFIISIAYFLPPKAGILVRNVEATDALPGCYEPRYNPRCFEPYVPAGVNCVPWLEEVPCEDPGGGGVCDGGICPEEDLCDNIDGIQSTVPEGYFRRSGGYCELIYMCNDTCGSVAVDVWGNPDPSGLICGNSCDEGCPDYETPECGAIICPLPKFDERFLDCPVGETGYIRQTLQNDVVNCTEGTWTTVEDTCETIGGTCEPPTSQTQTVSCPAGQTGTMVQTRYQDASCNWGDWITTDDSGCEDVPAPPPCTPSTSCSAEGQTCGELFNGCEFETCGGSCGPAASLTLSATPSSVYTGQASTLSWTGTSVYSCVATANPSQSGWTGSKPNPPNSQSVTPNPSSVPGQVSYRLTCNTSVSPFTAIDSVALVSVTSAPPAFDYSLSRSSSSLTLDKGGSASGSITITRNLISGTSQPVSLSVSGQPNGVSIVNFSNPICNPTCASNITFAVNPSTPNGTYPITVTGTSPIRSTVFNLIITGSVASATCSPSATSVKIGQPVTWTASASGGTPPYTYSWSGTSISASPAPSSNPYVHTYTTVGQKTAFVSVNGGEPAMCGTTVRVYIDPNFIEF